MQNFKSIALLVPEILAFLVKYGPVRKIHTCHVTFWLKIREQVCPVQTKYRTKFEVKMTFWSKLVKFS